MLKVKLHDREDIEVFIKGEGPAIMLSVNPFPIEGAKAEELKAWGVDPALGYHLIEQLSQSYRVIAFDYEGHLFHKPKPQTLTAVNIVQDFLAIADAAEAAQFAYYGYSWLALVGLQLAIRSERLTSLIMGGYPPIHGPYEQMLAVTNATHLASVQNASFDYSSYGAASLADDASQTVQLNDAANSASSDNSEPTNYDDYDWSQVEVSMNEGQTKQFVTLYEHLQSFNDREAQALIQCPKLCFAGSKDTIHYGEQWGNVVVDIVGPLQEHRTELARLGWEVHIFDGLDHTGAMQPNHVLPLIKPWLDAQLLQQHAASDS